MIVDISRFASETWKIAGKDFKQFFSRYARNSNVITAKRAEFRQFKHFKSPESNKPKRNYKNKQNMVSAIEWRYSISNERYYNNMMKVLKLT
ncbi:unnamed protein product [Rhizophagus irregularis]|nr:unnamed protein product [Rhizophagus irregularis]